MSKLAVSLEDYIYTSIWSHPCSYSRNTWLESKFAVLRQLFLVIGNGVEYVPEFKNFNSHEYPILPEETKAKLNSGEKIVVVWKGYSVIEVCFYKDFIKSGREHLIHEKPSFKDREKTLKADVYPDNHYSYIERLNKLKENDGSFDKPYPYSLHHTPMWDRENHKLIDKDLILPDWREGIVEIYIWAKEWMESDNFDKDDYFNWTLKLKTNDENSYFMRKWNERESMEQLCVAYAIPFKDYQEPMDMVRDIVAKNRKKYIDTAQLIVDTYK